jgi:hypothetical protein
MYYLGRCFGALGHVEKVRNTIRAAREFAEQRGRHLMAEATKVKEGRLKTSLYPGLRVAIARAWEPADAVTGVRREPHPYCDL